MSREQDIMNLRAFFEAKVDRYAELDEEIENKKDLIADYEKAIDCITTVLSVTQEGIIHYIEGIMELALQYVHGEQYSARLIYEMKRNQPEVRIMILKDSIEMSPKFSCGIGVVDVASFALRLALWSIIEPRTAPVIVTDEPFRHISGEDQVIKAGMMVKKLASELGLQIIIVSGKKGLVEHADRVFGVSIEKGVSSVKIL